MNRLTLLVFLVLLVERIASADVRAPVLESPENNTDKVLIIGVDTPANFLTATGGRTEAPRIFPGKGQWMRTGHRKYQWHVKQDDPSVVIATEPSDGAITSSNRIRISTEVAGSGVQISVALLEEWSDASGQRVWCRTPFGA